MRRHNAHPVQVILVVGGTRGDVQPFVVLAHELQRLNVPVRIAAHERWRPLLESQHIAWYALPDDPTSLLLKPAYRAALSLHHGIVRGLWHTIRYLWHSQRLMRAALAAVQEFTDADTLIVASLATQWAMPPQNGIWGLLQPIIPTTAFVSPLWPWRRSLMSAKTTHRLINWGMWQPWVWAGGRRRGGLHHISAQRALLAVSPVLMPAWPDRHSLHLVTGFWHHVDPRPLPAVVIRFLRRGTPFVVITMGSPGHNEPVSWYLHLCAAARAAGVDVVMHTPKGFVHEAVDDDGVCVVSGDLNHQALFRGAHAVIHHGGAGTFHTACAVGVPSLIIARGVDQQFWGERAVALGIAPCWMIRNRAKLSTITEAIADVIADPSYRYQARAVAQQMASEQGAHRAAQIIAQYVRS